MAKVFYQVKKTTTTLGGSPHSESKFFEVWDNAFNYHKKLMDDATNWGYRLNKESKAKCYYYMDYWNDRTGTTIEIEVFTREFSD